MLMKRINSFVVLTAMLLFGITVSMAQSTKEVNNYSFGFDSQSSIGNVDDSGYTNYLVHDFAPAGWDHLIDYYQSSGYSSDTYVNYRFNSDEGTGGGCLQSSAQDVTDYDTYETVNLYDLLITPLVSGKVQVVAKSASSYTSGTTSSVKFYKMTKSGSTWLRGDEIDPDTVKSLSWEQWSTYTLTVNEPTYIGMRINYALVDNFTAEHATIEQTPKLTITNTFNRNGSYNDADAEGNVNLKYDIVLTNSGLVAFNPGDENYYISLTRDENGEVLGTFNIDKALAVGASDTIHTSFNVPIATLGTDQFDAYVKENITGNQHFVGRVKPVPYTPVLTVTTPGSSLKITDSFAFGASQKPIINRFILTNDGASPLNITSVSIPAPFIGSLPQGRTTSTIQAHQSDTLTVTLPNTNPGTYSGNLVIGSNAGTYTLAISGTEVDTTAWFVDFEDMSYANQHVLPASITAEVRDGQPFSDWSISNYPQSLNLVGNKLALMNNNASVLTKVISPKLTIAAGQSLTFDAAQRGTNSILEIYYSTDRKNWIKAYNIVSDSANAAANDYFEQAGEGNYYKYYYFNTFKVNTIPAGEYYVAFNAGNVVLDNILGYKVADVAHDIYFATKPKAPATAMVNYGVTDNIAIHNSNTKSEDAANYTVQYCVGNDVVAHYDGKDLAAGADAEYAVSYTPHKAGKFPVYAKVVFTDGTELTSDSDTINVSEEVASNDVQIGTPSPNGTSTVAPANLYYHYSQGAMLYPADLIGLANGTQIKSIKFKGYVSKAITFATKVWIGNSTLDAIPASVSELSDVVDTTALTKVYDADYDFTATGSATGWGNNRTLTSSDDVLTIQLAEPFTYTGGNLVISVITSNSGGYANAAYEADTNYPSNAAIQAYDNSSYTSDWSNTYLPVVYFGVDASTPILSGSVKDAQGAAVANAPVVLTSGGVQYSDTTDAQGAYSIPVVQKNLKYTLSVAIAGYVPYSEENIYVVEDTTKDIVLETATGLFIQSHAIPANGQVNSKLTATAIVLNDIAQTIGAADYTAQLFINDEAVASATTADIESMKTAKLSFDYTPHEAGEATAYIQFNYGENVYKTSVDTINIADESFGGLIQVGDSTGLTTNPSTAIPWNNWYKYSQAELIYTASDLGLDNGAVIKKVAFRGSFRGDDTGNEALRVYIENTADDPATTYADYRNYTLRDTTAMTEILNGSVAYGDTASGIVHDVLSIPISEGFVYTGNNIRITVIGDHDGQSDNRIDWVVDRNKPGRGVNRRTDSGDIDETSWSINEDAPVLYLTVDQKKTVNGTVTTHADGSAVAGASVVLKSDDVEYSTTTDASGNYSIDVAKGSLTYDLITSADGYKADTIVNVVFGSDKQITKDVVLCKLISVSGLILGTNVGTSGLVSEPISGATVTVIYNGQQTSALTRHAPSLEDIVATATTDTEGNYTVDSLVETYSYKFVIEAAGYKSDTIVVNATTDETMAVAGNDVLYTEDALGINGVKAGAKVAHTGDVYSISGQYIGRNIDKATLRRGVYIIDGKKVTVK